MIEKLGGWPVTDSEWNSNNAIDLETLVAVIKRNFTLGVLIKEWVGPDDPRSENDIFAPKSGGATCVSSKSK